MSIEQEVSSKVYRLMELYRKFSEGLYEEMNSLYSDEFEGRLYMPWVGKVESFNSEEIKQGNRQAAEFYKNKDIDFYFTGLKILPQSDNQAAVSYEVIHQNQETYVMVRALAMEVWLKEADGEWRIIRWHEEKGMRV